MEISNGVSQRIEFELRTLGAEILHKVKYPRSGKKLLDYVVKKDTDTTFVKVIHNVNTNSYFFKELKKFANFLNINALVITDKMNGEDIIDGILHIRDRVGIVQIKTVHNIARGERVYIYEFKGMFYVKIDGKKLKELRLRKGYGLSELAKFVGTSIKALQMYEEGLIDMTVEKAYRFMEIFNKEFEEVLKEVNIFKDRISDSTIHRRSTHVKENETKQKLIKILNEQGVEAEAFNYLPSDIIVSKKGMKIFISLIDDKIDWDSAVAKARENKMLSRSLDGIPVNVINDNVPNDILKELENYGVTLKYEHITKHGIGTDIGSETI